MCGDRVLDPRRRPAGDGESIRFRVPEENIVKIDEGLIYQQTDKGEQCNFGEVFQTDGRIAALDLELIEDDKSFFPIYNPALNVPRM